MNDFTFFLSRFIKNPSSVASIRPSPLKLVNLMLEGMGIETADTIVEFGPGTGPITKGIADRIRPGAFCLGIELDKELTIRVGKKFPQFKMVNDSAENMLNLLQNFEKTHADVVVSGLPWANFDQDVQVKILDSVTKGLSKGGRFATIAFLHGKPTPAGKRFKKMLQERFTKVEETKMVWSYFPPIFAYQCTL